MKQRLTWMWMAALLAGGPAWADGEKGIVLDAAGHQLLPGSITLTNVTILNLTVTPMAMQPTNSWSEATPIWGSLDGTNWGWMAEGGAGGDASGWSGFAATQIVNMAGQSISNAPIIYGDSLLSAWGILLRAHYDAGGGLRVLNQYIQVQDTAGNYRNVMGTDGSGSFHGTLTLDGKAVLTNCVEVGIWGLNHEGHVVVLPVIARAQAGLWKMDANAHIVLSGNNWTDLFWGTNGTGEVITREVK